MNLLKMMLSQSYKEKRFGKFKVWSYILWNSFYIGSLKTYLTCNLFLSELFWKKLSYIFHFYSHNVLHQGKEMWWNSLKLPLKWIYLFFTIITRNFIWSWDMCLPMKMKTANSWPDDTTGKWLVIDPHIHNLLLI